VQGYEDGTYRPNQNVNRAEFLKVLMTAAGKVSIGDAGSFCFKDFKGTEQWYWMYACLAKSSGVINGYDDGPGSDGIIHLWDWRYFDNILRKKTYAVDDEEVRDYFPTNVVVERMLQLYQTILGLSFREIENPLTWHPSVKLYEVTNTGSTEPIGYFYLDLFPREGKYPQAETAALVTGRRRLDGSYQKPVSALIANVRNATNTRPSLLSHKEIVVLFHEFGHIMHHTLCKNKYGRLTAFNVSSDFIETPSQMMENWTWDRDILEFLSGHYKDQSQKIPRDMSEKIVAARYTGVGLNTLMQLSLALIDLTYHGPSVPRDPSKAFAKTFSDTALIPFYLSNKHCTYWSIPRNIRSS
jgi:thimet oligopeptidase